MRNQALARALELAGGVVVVARILGIRPQAVSQWKQCPPQHVLELERKTGVAKEQWRPDLYRPRRLA